MEMSNGDIIQSRFAYALRTLKPSWYQALPPSKLTKAAPGIFTYEIPGRVAERHSVRALGDTGAKYNFIKEEYAVAMGARIDRTDVTKVTITRDRSVYTTGTTQLDFSFERKNRTYPLVFHLLPNCLHDIILGKAFLKATKTFSVLQNLTSRVRKRIVQGFSHFRLCCFGESSPKFTGLLNGRPREALADSGAGGFIMDEDYARKMGIPFDSDPDEHTTVYFADGSTGTTSGMTYGVRWQFGLNDAGKEHLLDFHILKNATADVILSDDFLRETRAFVEYDCYLIDEDDEDDEGEAYFYTYRIDESLKRKVSIPEQDKEIVRRTEADDDIDELKGAERQEARQCEDERRVAWDAQYVAAQGFIGSSVVGNASPATTVPQASDTSITTSGTNTSSGLDAATTASSATTSGTGAPAIGLPTVGSTAPAIGPAILTANLPSGAIRYCNLKQRITSRFGLKRKRKP